MEQLRADRVAYERCQELELAQEAITSAVSVVQTAIHEEEQKTEPDLERIENLQSESNRLRAKTLLLGGLDKAGLILLANEMRTFLLANR